ncbi:MAG TPA: Dyp-type peroxidase [Acidimicrobiales bacterium]|nr:Dyp-type peroxidase [Acidimicrobiales bacterium]
MQPPEAQPPSSPAVPRPQPGIFALGVPEHCYLELDLVDGADPAALVRCLAELSGPETTVGGLNVVVGVRPELWRRVSGSRGGPGPRSFRSVDGAGVRFPATQHDAWVWVAGGSRDAVFDAATRVLDAVAPVAAPASEVTGWLYRHRRDLTGFIDGTENPSMLEAADVAVAADGSSVLLYQQWRHHRSWAQLSVEEQERVIGRSKADSVELADDVMPDDSHVSRNVVEEGGEELRIYRRNTAYGGPSDHGTVFVGFCAEQRPLQVMLERMAGVGDGIRDALTRHATALSGAYYLVPSVPALEGFLPGAG